MNELNLHIEYVQRHPRDRMAARALVDRIEEQLDRTRAQALRAVADYVVVARNVHAVLLATRICRKGARYLGAVQVIVGAELTDPAVRFNILIRDGWRPPTITGHAPRLGRGGRRTPFVTVGARWLLVALRDHLRQVSRVKRKFKHAHLKVQFGRRFTNPARPNARPTQPYTEYHW